MKPFSFFIMNKSVKRQASDTHLSDALVKEALDRISMAREIAASQKSKYVVENAYEAIRECIDSILFLRGYKSYSHEASIAYLDELEFTVPEIEHADWLRKKRNGIKYYGEDASEEEAKEALKIADILIQKLIKKKKNLT